MPKILNFPEKRSSKGATSENIQTIDFGEEFYVGETKNQEPHGTGKMTWPEGTTYEGEWENGLMHGHGVVTLPSGSKWDVYYENGEFAVDYAQLDREYINMVCELFIELFVDDLPETQDFGKEITWTGDVCRLAVSYGTEVAKFSSRYDDASGQHQLFFIEADGQIFRNHEANEWGKLMERILFIPKLEDGDDL